MTALRLPVLFALPGVFLACTLQRSQSPGGPESLDISVYEPGDLGPLQCAAATYEAKQEPAALLVVLDRSSSMAQDNKWAYAAQAIVQAIDQDIFDSMSVGLYAAPSGTEQGPACIFNLPVACLAPPFPQIDIQQAGAQKSGDNSGVRHDIKQWLENNVPDSGIGDATPLYQGIDSGIKALQGWTGGSHRILLVVTDGTISCNQFSNRPGFPDCNVCDHDWEDPNNIVKLVSAANQDMAKPVDTFMVGVPGADTYDPKGCNYPPYHMRLALSAIAYAGSPNNVPAGCDGRTFSQGGGDPMTSCHFDLTKGSFDVKTLADTISLIRGKVLGCVFDLPQPDGGTIDKDRVNVTYTINGKKMQLFRRKDQNNPCTDSGCWDYGMDGKVQLIGKSCDEVKTAPAAKVEIAVGCATILG